MKTHNLRIGSLHYPFINIPENPKIRYMLSFQIRKNLKTSIAQVQHKIIFRSSVEQSVEFYHFWYNKHHC